MTAARNPSAGRARGGSIRHGTRALVAGIRATPRPLALILLAATVLALAWSLVLPPFQGPDESDHFAYVQHLAETGSAPSWSEYAGAGSHSTEQGRALDRLGLRMLMGSLHARPAWSERELAAWDAFEARVTRRERADGEGLNPVAKNPPLYYVYEAAAYRLSPDTSLFGRLLTARLATVALFLATVALAWLAAAELTTRTWARTLTAGVVALQPQLTMMAGIVNADMLLVAVWTAFAWLAIRALRRGPTARRVLGLAVLAAASALTHGRGLALLPALAAVLVLALWRHRPPLHAALRRAGGAVAVLLVALGAFRIYTTAGGGDGRLYGTQTAYLEQSGFNLRQFLSTVWQFYLPPVGPIDGSIAPHYGFKQMYIETFYGAFGWLEVRFPPGVYELLQLATVAGLVTLVVALVERRRLLRTQWHVALGLTAIAGSLIAMLHLVSYLSLLGSPDPLIVGRYLLPGVVLFALAITFVATSLPRRLGPPFAAVVLAIGVTLQLGGLAMTAERFYA